MENRELFSPKNYLQGELLSAAENQDRDKINQLKRRYRRENPEQLEGVEALFGLRDFLLKQKEIDERRESGGYRKVESRRFEDLTEYQFLFTHYVLSNMKDKDFLVRFWETAESISKKTKTETQVERLRRGVLSQAAVYKILEELGENPQLSKPKEDAFHKIDLWMKQGVVKGRMAVQAKAGQYIENPAVIESEHISFPAISAGTKEQSRYYNSKYFQESALFRAKIKDYGKTIGENIKGYMLIIPFSKIDGTTGEPAPELVEFFKEKIQTKEV